jgi:D-glycero-beta-D-manno-heptose 1-phosphate adenylyltransferase
LAVSTRHSPDLILAIHPEVPVKGDDWPLENIVGSREMLGWGGQVHSNPFLHAQSTTAMLNKIRA